MEACSTAHHWARRFQSLGFEVRLIGPRYVAPFVKTNKNDRNDAEAKSSTKRKRCAAACHASQLPSLAPLHQHDSVGALVMCMVCQPKAAWLAPRRTRGFQYRS